MLLRSWLNEIKHYKYFKHLNKLRQLDETTFEHSVELNSDENKSLETAFMNVLINPSKFDNQFLSTLSMISNKGCRCSRHIPPAITDLEFDIFLNKLIQSYQAAVIIVYDSRLPDGIHIGICDLLCQLYIKQQNTLPTSSRTVNDEIHIVTASDHFSERLYDKYKIAGTGACYEELPWSKEQLDKKVAQCRNQLTKQGFSIPTDFQFV
ncbi:unnamed protein product [Schistosoma mattheei]|uniref:Uncharacterized protein n=1 Tax=Schistosoma mattheei TaxID=31246 RepID=A0A3P8GAQ7_9TREM|nr:unnamed protein product [Schistosoma mattheei]